MKRLRERETRKKQSCVFLVLLFERKQLTAGKRRERTVGSSREERKREACGLFFSSWTSSRARKGQKKKEENLTKKFKNP